MFIFGEFISFSTCMTDSKNAHVFQFPLIRSKFFVSDCLLPVLVIHKLMNMHAFKQYAEIHVSQWGKYVNNMCLEKVDMYSYTGKKLCDLILKDKSVKKCN